ncbi:unnamed protein product [Gordionus sp. m RMFG-2023]
METTSRLVDLGDFYLQVTLIKKNNGMILGSRPTDKNQPPDPGVRRKRCFNCQGEGHLRHQCSRPLRGTRVPLETVSDNAWQGPNDGKRRAYRELGPVATSVPQGLIASMGRPPQNDQDGKVSIPSARGSGISVGNDILHRAVAALATHVQPSVESAFGEPRSGTDDF